VNGPANTESPRALLARAGLLVVCGVLPLLSLYYAIAPVVAGDRTAADFHVAFYPAAESVLRGEDFYPSDGFVVRGEDELIVDYVYPPVLAVATVPWTLLPVDVAEIGFMAMLVGAFVAALALLGVRDWRCYGLAFLWPPVTDAVTTGNVSILLALAAALAWRVRDRPLAAGASVGVGMVTKIVLWPLVVWLAASRRVVAAAWSVGIGLGALLVSWAVIGFRGMADYPGLVRRLTEELDEQAYTVYALAVDLGLPSELARALWAALAVALLAATIVVARRGEERRAFVLALAAAIACSPLVWLHYFALLLVVVAVVQPRLGLLWFVGIPLKLVVTTGVYNGSTFQTAAVLGAATVTVGLALYSPAGDRGRRLIGAPAAARP
jgi:hypothetical protein